MGFNQGINAIQIWQNLDMEFTVIPEREGIIE